MRKDQKDKIYYVCSLGGCVSKYINNRCNQAGHSYHIHSRYPPQFLEHVGRSTYMGGKSGNEHFNGKRVSDHDAKRSTVIYLFRDPRYAILSRIQSDIEKSMTSHPVHMGHWAHMHHIQCPDDTVSLLDIKNSGEDLYKLKEFHDNYTKPLVKREYPVVCVNVDKLLVLPGKEKIQQQFKSELNLPSDLEIKTNKTMKEYNDKIHRYTFLKDVYHEMITEIKNAPAIYTI